MAVRKLSYNITTRISHSRNGPTWTTTQWFQDCSSHVYMVTLSLSTVLIHKAREHSWCRVVICTEEYTSKTCGFCSSSYIHKKLGGSKVFCCPQCKMVPAMFFFDVLQKRSRLRLTREPIP